MCQVLRCGFYISTFNLHNNFARPVFSPLFRGGSRKGKRLAQGHTHRGPKSPFQATSWIALFYEIKSPAKFPLRKPELRNWATLAQKLVVQLRALRSQTIYCASLGLSFFICKMSLTRILTKKGCGKVKQFHRKNLA